MNKLSLFSGIGGDDLASDMAGIETVCFVERDPNCRKVLSAHWPGVPIIEDVKDVTKETLANAGCFRQAFNEIQTAGIEQRGEITANCECVGRKAWTGESLRPTVATTIRQNIRDIRTERRLGIDIVSGGFPCQPHSVAGKRQGSSDERDLWPEVRRILSEIRPRWFVGENVPGLLSSNHGDFFGGILSDLAALGYFVGWCTYGAVDVGAWHRRDRVFIVAYSASGNGRQSKFSNTGREREISQENRLGLRTESCGQSEDATDTTEQGLERTIAKGSIQAGGLPTECRPVSGTEGNGRPQSGNTRTRWTGFKNDSKGVKQCGTGYEESSQLAIAGVTTRERGNMSRIAQNSRQSESRMGNLADGFPSWLAEPDGVPRIARGIKARVAKLKALGNAVCPLQIYPIYKAIVEIEINDNRKRGNRVE